MAASSQRPKNAGRRLSDRLWDASGAAYDRVVSSSHYYVDRTAVGQVFEDGSAVATIFDHSALRQVEGAEADALVREFLASADGYVVSGCMKLRPTLWRGAKGILILFEEDH